MPRDIPPSRVRLDLTQRKWRTWAEEQRQQVQSLPPKVIGILEVLTQELPETLADPVPLATSRVEKDDEARRVRAAVSRLPEKQRATLILKIYHELTHEEVAEILGSTVGTVKANLFHALGNLRRLVNEERG